MTGMDHVMGTRLTPVVRGAGLVTAFSILLFCTGPVGAQPSAPPLDAAAAAAPAPETTSVCPLRPRL